MGQQEIERKIVRELQITVHEQNIALKAERQRYEKLANIVCSMLDDYVEHGYDSSCLYPRIDDFEEFFDRSWQHIREKK